MNHTEEGALTDYFLFASLIAGIVLASLAIYYFTALGSPFSNLVRIFMAVFFLVFGTIKVLDLKSFAESYVNYDVVAHRFPAYGYAYPFIELALSLGYFFDTTGTDLITLAVMAIGSYGVSKELLRGRKIRCACLGSFIRVPLTRVSLVENVTMGIMALVLIFF